MADLPSPLFAIIDAIEQLTPTQRRQLQRRLYASGLFVPETLLTDQNRLASAPALGNNFLRRQSRFVHAEKQKGLAPPASCSTRKANVNIGNHITSSTGQGHPTLSFPRQWHNCDGSTRKSPPRGRSPFHAAPARPSPRAAHWRDR